jgi:hypothetical protein
MKKFAISLSVAVSVISLLIFTGIFAAVPASSATDESWAIPSEIAPGFFGAVFIDSQSDDEPSYFVDSSKLSDRKQNPTCANIHEPSCNLNDYYFDAVLPTCESDSEINCIVGIGAVDSKGKKFKGVYSRNYPNKAENDYVGDSMLKIPSGTSGSLFTIPGINHAAGDTFYARALIKGHGRNSQPASVTDFEATITPVAQVAVNTQTCGQPTTCPNAGWANADPHSGGNWGVQGVGYDGLHNCVAWSTGEHTCEERHGFPAGYSFFMELRVNAVPSGWLHGRLSNPNLSITKSGEVTTLELSGNPVSVPVVYGGGLYKDLPQTIKDAYDPLTGGFKEGSQGGGFGRLCCETVADPNLRNYMSTPSPSGWQGLDELKVWLPFVHDEAVAMMSTWSVRTLANNEAANSNRCFLDQNKVTGIVTTNSTEYSAGPPTFDSASGSLNYQVASPHFNSVGEVFKGVYDLVMASSVARCVYGFSDAPIKAEISVTSADGSPEVATTIVGERSGWLHMSANNFEFSSPTVQVKLTQDAPAPVPAPAKGVQSMGSTTNKVLTITCTKGKISKSIRGRSCPAGYKKK